MKVYLLERNNWNGLHIIKSISIIFSFCISSFSLFAQDFKSNCSKDINFQREKDLLAVIEYHDVYNMRKDIFLVDYVPHNDTSVFFVLTNGSKYALFYKKPDCYYLYNESIVYLYTPLYTQPKDTLWLQQLFDLTRVILRDTIGEIPISWANDSILIYDNSGLYVEHSFNPYYIEYRVYNGIIIKALAHELNGYFYEMYYPDIGQPKGVYNKYDAIKFYESEPNRDDYWKR